MKFGKKRRERWSRDWEKHSRKNGYLAKICYNHFHNIFYFMIHKGDYVFNSTWKDMKYSTEQECCEECEKYILSLATETGGEE